jgi:hypothetical protein
MAIPHRSRRTVSTKVAFLTLAGTQPQSLFFVVPLLLITLTSFAQEQRETSPDASANTNPPSAASVTIPAGTRFALVLTNPVASRSIRRGDEVYTQTIAPIVVGDQIVVPPGTFVQGKLDKLWRKGSRAQVRLQSASLVFPNGMVTNTSGPVQVEGEEGTAWLDAGGKNVAGAIIAPLAGLGLGTLIGHATGGHGTDINGMNFNPGGLKSTAIGGMVGLAAGGALSFVFLARSHHFFVDTGSPMQMTLPESLTLTQRQISDVEQDAQENPVTPMPVAKRPPPALLSPSTTSMGTCYTPETPATPPTIIPGTPAVGNTPGTPPTVIPGRPAIPGTPYPCP